MDVNPKIFRAYDVRGIYPAEVNEEVFYELGRVFAAYLNKTQKHGGGERPQIVVGRDIRVSSEPLAKSFIKGVLDFGFNVIDIGLVTTPMFYFGVIDLKTFGGALITASHNPADYNGVKFVKQLSGYVGGEELQEIYQMIGSGENRDGEKGECAEKDIHVGYLNFVCKDFQINRDMNVVVDASSGSTALFLREFLEKLKIKYTPLFFEVDGSFSAHNPNPLLEESQQFVKEKISETNADFGVIFDGDGDRIVFIDENSNTISGDIAGAIIADTFLKKGDAMCNILTSTRAVRDYFEKKAIRAADVKVGRYFIHKEMKEKDIDFCSEFSGHYYFKMLHYTESTFLALRLMLESLGKNPNLKISDLAKPFLKYFHSGEINLPLKSKERWGRILEELKKEYKNGKQSFEDGILVEYPNWWFNLRSSNTEPIMRLVVEAKTKGLMGQKKEEVLEHLKKFS